MSNIRLYVVVDLETLDSVIPDDICKMLGYESESILREKTLIIQALNHDLFLISVNLKAQGMDCAWSGLTESEIEMANVNYGESNLLTREQCLNLPFKEIEII